MTRSVPPGPAKDAMTSRAEEMAAAAKRVAYAVEEEEALVDEVADLGRGSKRRRATRRHVDRSRRGGDARAEAGRRRAIAYLVFVRHGDARGLA